jgi:hypothetical protein
VYLHGRAALLRGAKLENAANQPLRSAQTPHHIICCSALCIVRVAPLRLRLYLTKLCALFSQESPDVNHVVVMVGYGEVSDLLYIAVRACECVCCMGTVAR